MIALHTAIAIVLVIGLIIKAKVDPVISLIIASIYLGLASGVGFAKTVEAITGGFGEIMAKVGLLIGFGVLIGSLLHAMGTFRKLVEALLRVFGSSRIPYAMAGAMSTIFPSIYVDVQVVLASPIARSAAPHLGARGLPLMAGAIGTGIFAGYVFMVPGLAAVSIAGLLDIPLGTWLMYGIVLGPLVALVTTFLFSLLLRTGYWKPEKDEEYDEAVAELEAQDDVADADYMARMPRLWVALLPIVIPLLLIAVNAFAKLKGDPPAVMTFLGNPTIALFIGLVGAYLLGRAKLGQEGAANALSEGFHTTGEILLITGIGGSLGAVIEASGLGDQLGGLFSADEGAPVVLSVLLAWFIAALLHLAIGSVSVAAIAAAGIIAPVLHTIDVSPIAIGLAIAAGSLFALQVNSNFFWMFRSLLGLSTSGALKSLTVVTSIASFVALPIVMALAFVV
ncbi:GntP family permease [Actinomycetota bacterium]